MATCCATINLTFTNTLLRYRYTVMWCQRFGNKILIDPRSHFFWEARLFTPLGHSYTQPPTHKPNHPHLISQDIIFLCLWQIECSYSLTQSYNTDNQIPPLYAPTVLTIRPLAMILLQAPSKPFSLPTFTADAVELAMFQYRSVGDTVFVPAGMGVWVPV